MMGNWEDKYEYIIQLGKELPLIDEAYKTPDNLIKGCQSRVWLHTELKDGKLFFTADSDAVITNNGSEEEAIKQIMEEYHEITSH